MTDAPTPNPTPLTDSPSPFLRHGAEQPVDWLPWGEAALGRARSEDRPILLDIGAVWCHWCHVMDRESYEDPEVAALINELYVPVKVDRDERPDVDARYQRAVQALTGQGGWPLTGFLTPDGQLFHGGTYFPPEDAHGRPGFPRVLREVARVWAEERDRATEVAEAIRERLTHALAVEAAPGTLGPGLLDQATDAFAQSFDVEHGGFGGAPKFPNPGGLGFLLDRWLDEGTELSRGIVDGTLTAMVDGGIHDQLGGGFHRYATDARWLVPHFEKMAYDNGPLLEVLARAAVTLEREPFRDAAAGIVGYYRDVAGDLVDAGGFPASQDADSGPDDDGDYWTWTAGEIRAAVGDDAAARAALLRWGLDDPGSRMHLDPERHVLFRARSVADVGAALDRSADEAAALLDTAAARLRAVRAERPRPFVDRTLYTGWVALVASGHLAAARHLGLGEAGRAGVRALARVWEGAGTLLEEEGAEGAEGAEDGVTAEARGARRGAELGHRVGDPDPGVFLADQAHAARAFLDAFEWTQDEAWLERAGALVRGIRERFAHPAGGLRDLPSTDGLAVLADPRVEITDSPEPSPTAVAAESMLRVAALREDEALGEAAREVLAAYASSAPRFAVSAPSYFRAVRWAVGPVTTVVVVEEAAPDGAGPRPGSLLEAALQVYRPATVVRRLDPSDAVRADDGEPALPDALRAMLTGDAPRAYVCAGATCAAPVASPEALRTLLREFPG